MCWVCFRTISRRGGEELQNSLAVNTVERTGRGFSIPLPEISLTAPTFRERRISEIRARETRRSDRAPFLMYCKSATQHWVKEQAITINDVRKNKRLCCQGVAKWAGIS